MSAIFRYRQRTSEVIAHVIFSFISIAALILSFLNLTVIRPMSLVPALASAFWILLMTCIFLSGVKEVGIRQWWIDFVGGFVPNRFLSIREDKINGRMIDLGYTFVGRKLPMLVIRSEGLKAIGYSKGQASAILGKDAHDWQTWLRFDLTKVEYNRNGFRYGSCILGPQGRLEIAEEFYAELVRYFESSGIHIELVAAGTCTDKSKSEQDPTLNA